MKIIRQKGDHGRVTSLWTGWGWAYHVQDSQIVGGPSWISRDRFNIEAKADSAVNAELRKLSPPEGLVTKHRMLQWLLADRFKLTLRRETRNMPIYALVVAKSGPKLQKSKDGGTTVSGVPPSRGPQQRVRMSMRERGGEQEISVQNAPLSGLTAFLSRLLGRTVVDKTGLQGTYNITLKFASDIGGGQMAGGRGASAGAATDRDGQLMAGARKVS